MPWSLNIGNFWHIRAGKKRNLKSFYLPALATPVGMQPWNHMEVKNTHMASLSRTHLHRAAQAQLYFTMLRAVSKFSWPPAGNEGKSDSKA
jgi:hypothetical protein